MKSKKAYSTGFTWIFGLVSLFGLGVMYIVFSQVFNQYLVPVIKNSVNSTTTNVDAATVSTVFSNIDKYMNYFNLIPFILFFMVVIYMILASVRKEREEMM